ncbi:MAG TPA: o-succinylbenzoate--CoA ligase [Aliicoccus persicus]|uniref:Putative long chain fatty acid-CoA ligase VraA n=1 Tax=Aliicoccus persicus TaxID=930138 RepID=A0A921DXH3_9STAP|nr:o-succinylbenzoate--CoA ligase [Aliicoccus persicus]
MNTHWLIEQYNNNPHKIAMIFRDKNYTFEAVYQQSMALAERIKSLETKRIGLLIHNSSDAYFLINACMLVGVEIVMINSRLTHDEITKQLADVDVDVVIATQPLHSDSLTVYSYESLMDMDSVSFEVESYDDDDILSIMFTSGTTGRAKAVKQTYGNHFASDTRCRAGMGYSEDSVWLLVNPIFHISGLSIVFRTLINGCTLVINEKFNEQSIIDLMNTHAVSHTSFVPIMLERLIDCEFDWTRLEGVLLGGAGVRTPLLKRALEQNIRVFNSYGMTETMSQMIMIPYNDSKILDGAVGKIINNEIILNEDSNVLVNLPVVTPGYLNAEINTSDGYFNTGDIGHIDDEGYLYILDRRQDLIISGGENIYPSEIEKVVHGVLPDVECVVVKKADDVWGEVPVLILECEEEANIISRLQLVFDEKLSRYKHPKDVLFVREIERTSTGKISRLLNREKFIVNKDL